MRITAVKVTNLFNIFTHTIPMEDSRIKIIHGPNGVGKTVLFRMIHGLFNYRYQVFSEIPFHEFRVTFDTGKAVFVRKVKEGKDAQERQATETGDEHSTGSHESTCEISIGFFDGKQVDPETYTPQKPNSELSRDFLRMIHTTTPLERFDDDLWFDVENESMLTLEDIFERFDNIAKEYWGKVPSWFSELANTVQTRFIQTQRLQQRFILPDRYAYRFMKRTDTSKSPNLTVEEHSRNIVQEIQKVSTRYADESQKIDRVFPKNLDEEWRRLKDGASPKYKLDELKKKLRLLDEKRTELMSLGLLQEHEAPTLEDVDEGFAGVYAIYVDDMENKFSVYDTISEQLQILTDFLNGRFQYKRLTIDKQKGFVVVPLDREGKLQVGQRIPTASLSSGEQHQLVLFYELLFDIKENSLILIDEPEISLHVTWQESFLEAIERASAVGDYDVLIATHSPDIIGEKEEWMVGLGNPESS